MTEVFSWRGSHNPRLREVAQRTGTYRDLDDWYYALTYAEGGRRAQSVHLGAPQHNIPHHWAAQGVVDLRAMVARWRSEACPRTAA